MIFMTQEQYEQYRIAVERKGKAMKLPYKERTGRYGKQYQEILDILQSQFKAYLFYYISAGRNDFATKDLAAIQFTGQQTRLFAAINIALSDGDLKKLDKACEELERVYEESKGKDE